MKRDFKLVEHTADAGVTAWGSTLEELFANAALGMASLMYEPETVRPDRQLPVEVKGGDTEELIVAFLGEILYLMETEHVLIGRVTVSEVASGKARGVIGVLPIPRGFRFHGEVKAATYHQLAVRKSGRGYETTVIFDL